MMHYRYTQDERFLVEKAWPLLKELATFWEDNLEWDGGQSRWVINDSGAREGGKDTNPITDLSFVNALFRFLLDTSDTLEGKSSQGETIHIAEDRKENVARLSQEPQQVSHNRVQRQDRLQGGREPEEDESGGSR